MPVFCCGFNEFGQVSSADNDRQRGFVSLPMVVDVQSKIRRQDVGAGAVAADRTDGPLSVGVSWSRILYVSADGSLTTFGDEHCPLKCRLHGDEDIGTVVAAAVQSVSCAWSRTCLLSRDGVCHVCDDDDDDSVPSLHQTGSSTETSDTQAHSPAAETYDRQAHESSTSPAAETNDTQASSPADETNDRQAGSSAGMLVSVETNDRQASSSTTETNDTQAVSPAVVLLSVETNDMLTLAVTSDRSLVSLDARDGHIERLWNVYRVQSVSCGRCHTLVLSAIGVVFSCGLGNHGQLGHGGVQSELTLRPVEALEGLVVSEVRAGGWHSMALSDCGDVYVWGWNDAGQLGLNTSSSSSSSVTGTQSHTSLTGEDSDTTHVSIVTLPHVLDLPPTSRDLSLTSDDLACDPSGADVYVVKLACGSRHSLAVTSDGHAYSWGTNDYGQLGHGDLVSRDCPTVVQCFVKQNLHVVDVFAGYWNSVFVTDV